MGRLHLLLLIAAGQDILSVYFYFYFNQALSYIQTTQIMYSYILHFDFFMAVLRLAEPVITLHELCSIRTTQIVIHRDPSSSIMHDLADGIEALMKYVYDGESISQTVQSHKG